MVSAAKVKKHKVYISPSTQEHNVGVAGYGTEEKRLNQIATYVMKELASHDKLLEARRNKPEMTLQQVVADSNKWGAELHVALHTDAGPSSARGCTTLINHLGGGSEKFAKILHKRISALTPTDDRGIKVNPELYEPRVTKCPCALIELGFHTNKDDVKWLLTHQEVIGKEIARAILEYFAI